MSDLAIELRVKDRIEVRVRDVVGVGVGNL